MHSFVFNAGPFLGDVRLAIDTLSVWFMAIIALIFIAGAIFGKGYMSHYAERKREMKLHIVSYIACFISMELLCVTQHSLFFLLMWEIMALSSFFLIIFESWKKDVMEAGINFFIQSHISVILLTAGFIVIANRTGSYDMTAIALLDKEQTTLPMTLLLLGFAVKAGFVPFHTWLPKAHPAAPAHISAVMSSVIIKIGIFGIIRMLTFASNLDFKAAGVIILAIAAISGLYGVMLAIVQHNLKKLLAYHSIENIGIIGMGIGVGCLGVGAANPVIAAIGFIGALLHTLNHALFKSVLFFTAGNVYYSTHTLDIERLGGLGKLMPKTAVLFLVASVAICGLPPLNGFVSEFMIYSGLFNSLDAGTMHDAIGISFAIFALVLIGGLAILCFTKAFGTVFLGTARTELHEVAECPKIMTLPLAVLCVLMAVIGLCPQIFVGMAAGIVATFPMVGSFTIPQSAVNGISIAASAVVVLIGILLIIRKTVTKNKPIDHGETWGCGYTVPSAKIQYTATSFVKTYAELFGTVLAFKKKEEPPTEIYSQIIGTKSSENYDRIERGLIEKPLSAFSRFMQSFSFLQNGKLQYYLLYGIVFITLAVILTFVI